MPTVVRICWQRQGPERNPFLVLSVSGRKLCSSVVTSKPSELTCAMIWSCSFYSIGKPNASDHRLALLTSLSIAKSEERHSLLKQGLEQETLLFSWQFYFKCIQTRFSTDTWRAIGWKVDKICSVTESYQFYNPNVAPISHFPSSPCRGPGSDHLAASPGWLWWPPKRSACLSSLAPLILSQWASVIVEIVNLTTPHLCLKSCHASALPSG